MLNSKSTFRTVSLLLALLLTVAVIGMSFVGCKDDKGDGTESDSSSAVTDSQQNDDSTEDSGDKGDGSEETEKRPPSEQKPSDNGGSGGNNNAGGGPTDNDLPIIWEQQEGKR